MIPARDLNKASIATGSATTRIDTARKLSASVRPDDGFATIAYCSRADIDTRTGIHIRIVGVLLRAFALKVAAHQHLTTACCAGGIQRRTSEQPNTIAQHTDLTALLAGVVTGSGNAARDTDRARFAPAQRDDAVGF